MVYLHPFHWAPFTNVRPRHGEMHRLVLPIQGWHHIDLPLCSQQPCHTGSHINLPVFSGWSEEVMKWRLQDLHLWNFWWLLLLFFDTSLANSYFRKHKFCFQSRTDIRHLQPPVFDVTCVTSGVSSPPSDPKCFYRFMRHWVSMFGKLLKNLPQLLEKP